MRARLLPLLLLLLPITAALALPASRAAPAPPQPRELPDVAIHYNEVTLRAWSHDAGGLTARDFALARTINATL